MDLKQQRVVIMGGSSGVGLAAARTLALAGASVTITGRDPRKLAEARQQLPESVAGSVVDATSRAQLDQFFAQHGPLEHLVLALSGGAGAGPFRELDLQSLREGFEAKFWAHVQAAQAALATLAPNGSITFISAISAQMANPGTAGLAAINAAIEALVPPLAAELKPRRINAISPGVINTPWWNWLPEAERAAAFAQYSASAAVGRVGEPEDVAHAIRFVIENTFVTGTVIACDGGLRLGV